MSTDIQIHYTERASAWIAKKCRLQTKAKEKEKVAVKKLVRDYVEHNLRRCVAVEINSIVHNTSIDRQTWTVNSNVPQHITATFIHQNLSQYTAHINVAGYKKEETQWDGVWIRQVTWGRDGAGPDWPDFVASSIHSNSNTRRDLDLWQLRNYSSFSSSSQGNGANRGAPSTRAAAARSVHSVQSTTSSRRTRHGQA